MTTTSPDFDLVSLDKAAELLSVSRTYIYHRTMKSTKPENRIPHYRRGTKLYFKPKELAAWITDSQSKNQ